MNVSAIIPAYNEERTLAAVVQAVRQSGIVSDVIVVDDGSADATARVGRQAGATVVSSPENVGKGAAMKMGAEHTDAPVLLYLDADLVGLGPKHVRALIDPVVRGRADMTIGIFRGGRWRTDAAQAVAPLLSGQRAMKRTIMDALVGIERSGYGVERALNTYARTRGLPVERVGLEGVSQVTKEELYGFLCGLSSRVRMYWEVVRPLRMSGSRTIRLREERVHE